MRNTLRTFALALVLPALWATGAQAEGEIWVWTTADDVVHYTDDRERVPEAFRASARVAHKEGSGSYQHAGPPAAPPADPAREGAQAAAVAAEASWRNEARQLDERITGLVQQVAVCGNDHVNLSPGDGSRKRREEREEAQRCRAATRNLAAARSERDALEERARREGAPPGWVRRPD